MVELLTAEEYRVQLKEEEGGTGNRFYRNSGCYSGGDQITVTINKHADVLITGVKIIFYPYIPDQNLGKEQTFNPIVREEEFDSRTEIVTQISVNPAVSYKVSVAYSRQYGYLSTSENVTSPGEFERMMLSHLGMVSSNFRRKKPPDFFTKNI